jgi:hypothetical protein
VARRTAIAAILAVLALTASVACSSGSADKAGPTATVATEPAPTTTTNPYAVPAVIDAAYVNKVLAGLDAAVGDVTRMILQAKTIPREAYDRLRALYSNDQRLQLSIDSFQSDMRRNFADYKTDPGNKISIVTQLLDVRRTCIFAKVSRDYSSVGINTSSSDTQWIALVPLESARDPQKYNKTDWAFSYEGYTENRTAPADPCAA